MYLLSLLIGLIFACTILLFIGPKKCMTSYYTQAPVVGAPIVDEVDNMMDAVGLSRSGASPSPVSAPAPAVPAPAPSVADMAPAPSVADVAMEETAQAPAPVFSPAPAPSVADIAIEETAQAPAPAVPEPDVPSPAPSPGAPF